MPTGIYNRNEKTKAKLAKQYKQNIIKSFNVTQSSIEKAIKARQFNYDIKGHPTRADEKLRKF